MHWEVIDRNIRNESTKDSGVRKATDVEDVNFSLNRLGSVRSTQTLNTITRID